MATKLGDYNRWVQTSDGMGNVKKAPGLKKFKASAPKKGARNGRSR